MDVKPATWARWVVLLIAVELDGERLIRVQPLGSGFAIAPRLLVTAAHVIEPIMSRDGQGNPRLKDPNVRPWAIIPGSADPFAPGRPVAIDSIRTTEENDVALLTTEIAQTADNVHQADETPALTITPPALGSTVAAMGYSEPTVTGDYNDDGDLVPQFNMPLKISAGTIQEHYPEKRDSVMINFPAAQGDFEAAKGMSGGPVIGADGLVCGVLSAAIDPDEDGGGWTSTCALLPFLFAMSIKPNVEGNEVEERAIGDLADEGIVKTDGTQSKVHWEDNEGARTVRWNFAAPSPVAPDPE